MDLDILGVVYTFVHEGVFDHDLIDVGHLSSFSYIDAENEVGITFQALSIAEPSKKGTSSFASYNDAKLAIEHGKTIGLGQMIKLEDNKSRAGIGYSSGIFNKHGLFQSGGFIHTVQDEEAAAIVEENAEVDSGNKMSMNCGVNQSKTWA